MLTSAIVKRVLATTVVAMVVVFLIDLLAGPVFSFSTQAWPPARQGDKLIGGIQGLVKATDPPASTVRISAGFLGLRSLSVVVTPETRIAVNGKFGGFGDLERGQRVRVTYEVYPDRLVGARVEVLDRSSDASEARVAGEESSPVMMSSLVPSVAPWTPVPPEATTSSSPHVTSPAPVSPRGAAPASSAGRSARPPVKSVRPARAPQTPGISRSARPPAMPPGDGSTPTVPPSLSGAAEDPQRRTPPSSPGSTAAPDSGVQGLTTPDPKPEATGLASTLPTTAGEAPNSRPESAPAESTLVDKIRSDWEAIKREARRGGDEWRDGWRRFQRLFTD